jgi:hypothetical protein
MPKTRGLSPLNLSVRIFPDFRLKGLCTAWRVTERVAFQFLTDSFNILNLTNFALASGNRVESSGTFGQISSTAGLSGGTTVVLA